MCYHDFMLNLVYLFSLLLIIPVKDYIINYKFNYK